MGRTGARIAGGVCRRRMCISAFCSGALLTCALLSLGLPGIASAAAHPILEAPPLREGSSTVFAAAVVSESPLPEGEGTPVAEPENGARHRRAWARGLVRTVRPFVERALRAAREPDAGALDLEGLLGFELAADHDPARAVGWEEISALGTPDGEEGGATSRFSASVLRTLARYRYMATPTVEMDSNTGTVLIGLAWTR